MIHRLGHLLEVSSTREMRRVFLRREYDRLGGYLGAFAREYRKHVAHRVRLVAVIGSVGKSTTTAAIRAALAVPARYFSPHNYGTSLAHNLLRVRPWDPWAVLETGIAGPGRMAYYGRLLRPDVVVVTSIRSDHNRSFPTLLHTRDEKVEMVRALSDRGTAVLNGDDEHVLWMASQTEARVVTFGIGAGNDVRATSIRANPSGGLGFEVELGGTSHTVRSSLIGEHMVYPLLAAIAVCHVGEVEPAPAIVRLSALPPEPSRMQLVELKSGIRILDDSYKGGIESVRAALTGLSSIEARRKVVVMGEIEEAPKPEREAYREIGERIAAVADVLVCVGGSKLGVLRSAACRAGLSREVTFTPGRHLTQAIPLLREILRPGDLVLVKGTYAQRLQRVALALQDHEVTCAVRFCNVKSRCVSCPLLCAPAERFRNPLVARYIKEPGL